ncbi:uncharacterized protein LOC111908763 [Lactuca sativa]|uniref:Coenzyme Q-binding protein COQ10 START domain-containing protein n=1 Tax=Lactuca sativa TaxID=4236 RepID=A0A9R1WVW1_LACSA|nr:uncharacterized protein LOC111908763 [Lactuca sativa]KAJ0188499.1 hypothetical protein LSAT_V11C900454960 [Lactuca sativa]
MQIRGLPITLDCCHPVNVVEAAVTISDVVYSPIYAAAFSSTKIKYPPIYSYKPIPLGATSRISVPFAASCSKGDSGESLNDCSDTDLQQVSEPPPTGADDIEVKIEKLSKNRRRIRSKVAVEASLETIWGILTDYDRLADFIPGLAVSQVLDKKINFARLLQIGEQKLAFGLVFNAKGIVDCYEKDFERLPCGQRRDIEFKMIEGDFSLFEGKWSIEQLTDEKRFDQQYHTTLSYAVDVEPKMWLPVQLVEGRLCKEIKMNLFSIREVAQKASDNISSF